MEIKEIALADLQEYEFNPRNNEHAVEAVAASIKNFGFKVPVIIDSEGVIIAGHTRKLAAEMLGLDKVPCIVADDLTPEQIKAFRLADNKVAELADWDFALLEKELAELDDFDMGQFGFDLAELEEEPEIIEDEAPEVDEEREPVVQRGQVWQLGKHFLMCGDSTSEEDIKKLMNNKTADMVFTDAPYGVSANGGRSGTVKKLGMRKIENDDLRDEELTNFLSRFIELLPVKDNTSIYLCCPWQTLYEFLTAVKENGLQIKNCIIWNKKSFGLNGFKGYRPQYEMLLFCCKEDFIWYGDLSQADILNVSREIKREEQGNHPTPKPIELITIALKNSSKKGDLVLDVFGGSGSTLIACEQLNRICYTMELDAKYCDVIIKRWENLTGNKAELIN